MSRFLRRALTARSRRRGHGSIDVSRSSLRAARITTLINLDVQGDELVAARAAATPAERADARSLIALARELTLDRCRMLELQQAFLVGGDEWRGSV